jgi:hypothetical protein
VEDFSALLCGRGGVSKKLCPGDGVSMNIIFPMLAIMGEEPYIY